MRIGVDLGGTKIEAVVMNEQGEILARERIATPKGDYAGTLAALAEVVSRAETAAGIAQRKLPVGVGAPGAVHPDGQQLNVSNSVALVDRPLLPDLKRILGRDVRMANDADCFALSEAMDGAAAGAPIVFGVIVGTGCGSGVVVNGQLLRGANGIAGEWGHNHLPRMTDDERPGPECYCGKHGCVESYLSGTGLCDDYERASGTRLHGGEIAKLAEAGDVTADAVLTRYENRMARALGAVINIIDPHVIVLGGGVSNIQRLYNNVPAQWDAYVHSRHPVRTQLRQAKYGDSSGVRGAAWLWPNPDALD
ncbi:ROK family protein [Magnetofaba australis]|uniref:Putative N-acetylglucosamine kinase n=1 Tax=Magnetofaba australis IT-1 TaxID=1434232 RepID=A0A1Y2K4A1_9PROT|nr:ROK family protein [Magnetofaba australis]OSM02487.1 putative N-acetylglucosamine kinase [Magnetofaba australis IT-1]